MSPSTGEGLDSDDLDEPQQVRLANHLVDLASLDLGRLDADQRGAALVERDDRARVVHRQDALDHAREHGLLLVLLAEDGSHAIGPLLGHQVHGVGQRGDFGDVGRFQAVIELAGRQTPARPFRGSPAAG